MDYNVILNNGQILKGLIKSPGSNLRCLVIMVHGLGEHIRRYDEWAEYFLGQNIAFTGVDLPGHGRTDGRRGHIKNYAVLDEIIEVLINQSKKTFPGIPVVLYGHSLGGLIVLNYLLKKQPSIKGAIVTSPLLRLAFEPNKSRLTLAAFMKHILPGLIQPTGLIAGHLSHDRRVVDAYSNDPLVHSKISVNVFTGTMNSARYCFKNATLLNVPSLLLHGSDDMICDPSGSIDFAAKAKMAELKIWEGGYHELHNEPFREEVFDYIMNWLNTKLKL